MILLELNREKNSNKMSIFTGGNVDEEYFTAFR